jgi:hypothetical protein
VDSIELDNCFFLRIPSLNSSRYVVTFEPVSPTSPAPPPNPHPTVIGEGFAYSSASSKRSSRAASDSFWRLRRGYKRGHLALKLLLLKYLSSDKYDCDAANSSND